MTRSAVAVPLTQDSLEDGDHGTLSSTTIGAGQGERPGPHRDSRDDGGDDDDHGSAFGLDEPGRGGFVGDDDGAAVGGAVERLTISPRLFEFIP
ncbi:MAG: hypothetical protein OXQ29_08905 [Rhodospirillaceae bacterium]|nr:hypothetical protein [Rhodospirillaceae bacterium]